MKDIANKHISKFKKHQTRIFQTGTNRNVFEQSLGMKKDKETLKSKNQP